MALDILMLRKQAAARAGKSSGKRPAPAKGGSQPAPPTPEGSKEDETPAAPAAAPVNPFAAVRAKAKERLARK